MFNSFQGGLPCFLIQKGLKNCHWNLGKMVLILMTYMGHSVKMNKDDSYGLRTSFQIFEMAILLQRRLLFFSYFRIHHCG